MCAYVEKIYTSNSIYNAINNDENWLRGMLYVTTRKFQQIV